MLSDLLPDIANNICLVYNIKPEDLSSASRKVPLPEARKMFTLLSIGWYQIKNISKYLKRDRTTVVYYMESAVVFLKHYPDFKEKYSKINLLLYNYWENNEQ